MKIFITSDWHLDAVTAGRERIDEVSAAAWHIAKQTALQSNNAFVFLGDLCNPSTARAHRADAVATAVAAYLRSRVQQFWLVGNHDIVEDGRGTHTLMGVDGGGAQVCATPGVFTPATNLAFVFLPYPAITKNYDVLKVAADLVERCRVSNIVVFSHLDIRGAVEGSESGDMARGRRVYLPVDEIRTVAERQSKNIRFFNGHYHKRQSLNGVDIPGSIARLRFDEERNVPVYLTVDVAADGTTGDVLAHEVPNAATMRTWNVADGDPPTDIDFIRLQGERARTRAVAADIEADPNRKQAVKVDVQPTTTRGANPATKPGSKPRDVALAIANTAPAAIRDEVAAMVERIMGQVGI